jgi:large subunit ribosomal protein L17
MRHHNAGRKFGRNSSHRRAMFRNLAANLVTHERIETTDAKAKELRRVAERLISKAKRLGEVAYTPWADLSPGDRAKRLHAQRMLSAFLPRFGVRLENGESKKVDVVEKIFLDLAKRYKDRSGGYTRIIKLGPRRGDNAPMVFIELIDANVGGKPADATQAALEGLDPRRELLESPGARERAGVSSFHWKTG